MNHFCTLFDSGYLARGLIMIESLRRVSPGSTIFVLAMDQRCHQIISALSPANVRLIHLDDFEDAELLAIKPGRTRAEYYWTCTASLIAFCISRFDLPACTYLDADLYFFKDPSPMLDTMGSDSILLTEHNYASRYNQSTTSGRFCVQFMYFKNDSHGLEALDWWRSRCLEWCFARHEDGKFGDQKYLDDWEQRFKGVRICPDAGYGVAPWNIQKFSPSWLEENMVFFHFHGIRFVSGTCAMVESYYLGQRVKQNIFEPYVKELLQVVQSLSRQFGSEGLMPLMGRRHGLRSLLSMIWHTLRGTYNRICIRN